MFLSTKVEKMLDYNVAFYLTDVHLQYQCHVMCGVGLSHCKKMGKK